MRCLRWLHGRFPCDRELYLRSPVLNTGWTGGNFTFATWVCDEFNVTAEEFVIAMTRHGYLFSVVLGPSSNSKKEAEHMFLQQLHWFTQRYGVGALRAHGQSEILMYALQQRWAAAITWIREQVSFDCDQLTPREVYVAVSGWRGFQRNSETFLNANEEFIQTTKLPRDKLTWVSSLHADRQHLTGITWPPRFDS
jgi:hypothetical protein